ERVELGIVDPRGEVVARDCPEGDHRLEELRTALGTANSGTALTATLAAHDRLLLRANEILQGMLKLETFNEALAMLRGIISEQEALLEKTKEQRKRQVLDLLK